MSWPLGSAPAPRAQGLRGNGIRDILMGGLEKRKELGGFLTPFVSCRPASANGRFELVRRSALDGGPIEGLACSQWPSSDGRHSHGYRPRTHEATWARLSRSSNSAVTAAIGQRP